MQISLGWKQEHLDIIVVLLSFTILYLIYHYSLLLSGFRLTFKRLIKKRESYSEYSYGYLTEKKISGIFLLGLCPFIIGILALKKQPEELGLFLSINKLYLIPAFIICALMFPVLLKGSKTLRGSRRIYLEHSKFSANLILWIPYIIAYEFCLRGFLLFPLERAIGSWPAIATVTAIYTAIHLHRERGEAAGSLIMGLIFGFFALSTRSIIIPVIVHLYIAISTELLMQRKKKRKRKMR
ncbi:MAG: CPBP family intramembrane glutamic endopeptidase [Spirochaetota bacterium]